jgi:NADH dehydrogenase FAD-containing subunit
MARRLVLVGGGHAHMVTLANLNTFVDGGHSVMVVGPSPYHYYSGMGPGMLSGTYTPEEIRFATRRIVERQGARFILDKVALVDGDKRRLHLESGEKIAYDVLSFNVGSYVPGSIVKEEENRVFTVKPIEGLVEAQARAIELFSGKGTTVGVVGGGPAGAEVAGNLWRLARDHGRYMPRIRVFCGERLMAAFPRKVRKKVLGSLSERGIEILEQALVKEVRSGEVLTKSGEKYPADLVFLALGIKPSPIFSASGLPTGPEGGLLVNPYLQSPQYPEIFGGGDCIYFRDRPLNKVGVYAVREGPVLYHNLVAALEGRDEMRPFDPGGGYLLIFNMGDGTGVLHKDGLVFHGRLPFILKDLIDRRYMRRFQAME